MNEILYKPENEISQIEKYCKYFVLMCKAAIWVSIAYVSINVAMSGKDGEFNHLLTVNMCGYEDGR